MDYHKPVLFDEVIENIITNMEGVYLDCTLGGAGHTQGILENTSEGALVIAIDQDDDAIEFAGKKLENYKERIKIFKDNFKNLDTVLYMAGYEKVSGILMDIGVSSYQLDDPKRGFSYKYEAKLDMRMDKSAKISAYEVINEFSEQEIADILYKYGEEPRARRIAKKITEQRKVKKIETTTELADIVIRAIGKSMKRHPAKRTFQAVRMYVNKELEVLEEALEKAVEHLEDKGRLLVITFHSLEDRIVKQTLAELAKGCTCPPQLPICVCGKKPQVKKPISIKPTEQEIDENPRSRSARLRGAIKI